jgi:hypothetical protein
LRHFRGNVQWSSFAGFLCLRANFSAESRRRISERRKNGTTDSGQGTRSGGHSNSADDCYQQLKAIVDWGCAPGGVINAAATWFPAASGASAFVSPFTACLPAEWKALGAPGRRSQPLEGLHTPLLRLIVVSIKLSLVFGFEDIPLSHPVSSEPRERDGQYASNEAPTRSTAERNPLI